MEPAAAGQALWRRWLWSWALKGPILGELEGKGKMTGSLGSEAVLTESRRLVSWHRAVRSVNPGPTMGPLLYIRD